MPKSPVNHLYSEARASGISLDIHTLLYSCVAMVIDLRSMLFWAFTKIYGQRERVVPSDPAFEEALSWVSLKRGLIGGKLLVFFGIDLGFYGFATWGMQGFRELYPAAAMVLLGRSWSTPPSSQNNGRVG